ncbi:ribonuclease III, partial [Patescibacteria group bacterium]|nr:ribonuclease III [Patescibacteria group bacterium]
ALYLDQGYDKTAKFISENLLSLLDTIVEKRLWQDSKSHFQEEAQERAGITPTYSTVKEIGPDHNKRFVVAVYLNNEWIAEGEGESKQEAEQAAAEKALKAKKW